MVHVDLSVKPAGTRWVSERRDHEKVPLLDTRACPKPHRYLAVASGRFIQPQMQAHDAAGCIKLRDASGFSVRLVGANHTIENVEENSVRWTATLR